MSLINKSRALSIVNILIAGPNRQKKLGEIHFPLLNFYQSICYKNRLKRMYYIVLWVFIPFFIKSVHRGYAKRCFYTTPTFPTMVETRCSRLHPAPHSGRDAMLASPTQHRIPALTWWWRRPNAGAPHRGINPIFPPGQRRREHRVSTCVIYHEPCTPCILLRLAVRAKGIRHVISQIFFTAPRP